MYQMMTPGPTMPAASVMEARSRAFATPEVRSGEHTSELQSH